MLQSLTIKNVALIKELNLDFGKGFNVLMGETGAGKSIIFDSLNFVLGAKADKTLIRHGEQSMKVDALFTNFNESTKKYLIENDLLSEDETEILLSRSLSNEMKNVCKINGNIVSLSILKGVGDLLVDSYSQHESVSLLKSKNHLSLLDKFGGEKISKLKDKVLEQYDIVESLKKSIKALGGDQFERERTKNLLTYQIDEIAKAELHVGEEEELKEKLNMFSSAEKINEALSICQNLLENSSSSVIDNLQESEAVLSSLTNFSNINECRDRLISSRYEIEDIAQTLNDIKNNLSFDEREFEYIDRRYDLVKSLVKKYGGTIEKTLSYFEEIQKKLNELADADFLISKYESELKEAEKELNETAKLLSDNRKSVAKEIEEKIVEQLKELGMKSTVFKVNFKICPITSNGEDDVEFAFSANKGQDIKALAKTASGGELSRFMLAIKNIFSKIDKTGTLIFDEIDAGISGETGVIVGQKIKNLTKSSQIICITHLPQVACFGDDYYFVTKTEDEKSTFTKVKHIDKNEIEYQIARMIGGDNVSEIALNHAKEMLMQAEKYSKSN